MSKKSSASTHTAQITAFSHFIEDPPVALTLLVIGLITLILAIMDFSQVIGY